MFVAGDVIQWVSVVVATLFCQRMSAKPDPRPRQSALVDIEASVQKTETWTFNKKFTVSLLTYFSIYFLVILINKKNQ